MTIQNNIIKVDLLYDFSTLYVICCTRNYLYAFCWMLYNNLLAGTVSVSLAQTLSFADVSCYQV